MDKIIAQLAEKYQLPKGVVKEAVESMIKYTKKIMLEDNLEGIMLPAFGKFAIKPAKKRWIRIYRRIKEELDRIENESDKRNIKWLGKSSLTRV